MKAKILTLLLVLAVIFTASAQPQRDDFRDERKMDGFRSEKAEGPMSRLNLTEEQKQLFQTIRLQIQKETKPFRNELRELEAKQQT
jgi:Spy/CpxP family protein refolding chaperone